LAEELQVRLHKELRSFIDTANAPIFGIDAQVRESECARETCHAAH
jgi:hypothetical protein